MLTNRLAFAIIILVILVPVVAIVAADRGGDGRLVVAANGTPLQVETARTPEERSIGLSGRDRLDTDGMLFIFQKTGNYAFWMRDTRIALDIIWIGEDRRVVHLERNVAPDTYPNTFTSPTPARFALEIAAGRADRLGISVGTPLSWDDL